MRTVLTVIGEALVDLVDAGDQRTFTAHPGGSPLNVAVGLARLGCRAELMARFSADAFGRAVREHAERNGVALSAAVSATQPSTLAVVTLDAEGRAHYDFYLDGAADWQWSDSELRVPPGTQILHTGSLASWLPPGDERIANLLRRSHDDMLISYDPNVRPDLLGTPERARPLVERVIASVHVVKASDEDIAWLYPGRRPDSVAGHWLDLGVTAVVVTRGENGACAYRPGQPVVERSARKVQLVDTIGAGDAFTAGMLSALSVAGVRDAEQLAAANLDAVLDEAILVAALTCERAGADPPTSAEVARARRTG